MSPEARAAAIEEISDRGAKMILRHRAECDQLTILMDKVMADWHVDSKATGRAVRSLMKTVTALAKKQDRERAQFGL